MVIYDLRNMSSKPGVTMSQRSKLKVRIHAMSSLWPNPDFGMCFISKSRALNLIANVLRGTLKYLGAGSNSTLLHNIK